MLTDEQMRYPIGQLEWPQQYTTADMQQWVDDIRTLPQKLRTAVAHLTHEQLDTPYRKDGWTIRQVVHHLADSHMNALTRVKLALSEEHPTIRPYAEDLWATQADHSLPIEPSLLIVEGLHTRLTCLFEHLTPTQWERAFYHPEAGADYTLKKTLANYAWHSRHHLAHITQTCLRYGF